MPIKLDSDGIAEGYPQGAKDFLREFYKGETDPEKKLTMLFEESPGQHSFHASGMREDCQGMKTVDVTTQMKIGALEHEMLCDLGLIERILC